MNLYLVQHGEAVSKEEDPQRPLSDNGIANVKKAATFAAGSCSITADKIFHSGRLRAEQTAEILATILKLPVSEPVDTLEPLADPSIWQSRLTESSEDLMLVGHLPYMAKLASSLLCDDPERNIVRFQMGGMVALKRDNNEWTLQWMIIPDILPTSGYS